MLYVPPESYEFKDEIIPDVGYYEIHRADRSYKTYIFFSEMLNDFDKEDLIVLYGLSNKKYASTRPGFDDLMLWGDMKIMFKPDEVSIHMLVEKKYPLPQDTLTRMLQWKLHVNYNVTEMAYKLLSIRKFVPMKSEGQVADSEAGEGSSKEGKSLKRLAEEELGQEQQVKKEIVQEEDVMGKQAEKESSKKARGRLKRKTS
nr:hypothetical protein [Tanacetum cinerariifolium]